MTTHFIELVSNNNVTYFQLVRRCDNAILFANVALSLVADKLYHATYEDGTKVVL